MKANLLQGLLVLFFLQRAWAINEPTRLITRSGDKTIVLHWDRSTDPTLQGYRVYGSFDTNGTFVALNAGTISAPSYVDLNATNGVTYYYQVAAVSAITGESPHPTTVAVMAHLFANDDEFLDYVQATAFDYFWYEANPANGLVKDRSTRTSPCSIAAVGFGLTAIGIAIDHGWITRAQGRQRVLATLNTFWSKPQGTNSSGTIGYNGWFYHFLDMNSASRYLDNELSSIDTALLFGGMLYAKQYFNSSDPDEVAIRSLADGIYGRVDWNFMAKGTNLFSMGWKPGTAFQGFGGWVGYNEGMILYVLGLGATNPVPASAWSRWTNGYRRITFSNLSFVYFPPLFGHQYSQGWIDFRHVADAYMNDKNCTYFENSRRATLAQRLYCIANPLNRIGYGPNVWGLTACDGPPGYAAHGAPPAQNDDGTIAPTAAGGSVAFAPEVCVPALRQFYDQFRTNIWTSYGFRDAFNLTQNWWDSDVLGIDEGPIIIAIENYRTQRVWKLFMQNPEIQNGLQRAGFVQLAFASPRVIPAPGQGGMELDWDALNGRTYQVEYSPDLDTWFDSPTGQFTATGIPLSWTDIGPPGTPTSPSNTPQRFYRILQFGAP